MSTANRARHPTGLQLQAYLDRELRPACSARVQDHVGSCPDCQRALASLGRQSRSVRGSRPGLLCLSNDEAFWMRLAGAIGPRRLECWPWVPYVPPVLLAALGMTVKTVRWALASAASLSGLGILPPLGDLAADGARAAISFPLLSGALRQCLSPWGKALAQATSWFWGGMARNLQETTLFLLGLSISEALLCLIAVCYVVWIWCWHRQLGTERKE